LKRSWYGLDIIEMLRDLSSHFAEQGDVVEQVLMNGNATAHNDSNLASPPELFDDVFGSAPSSPTISRDDQFRSSLSGTAGVGSQHPSDIPRLRSTHVTSGYREGLASSKEKYMQEGFDEGYSLGAELALKAGWCLGMLKGMVNYDGAVSNVSASICQGQDTRPVPILAEAEAALKVEKLFGREYFGEDGVWTYNVPGQDDAEERGVGFAEVASAHPVIKHWVDQVKGIAAERGISHMP
jgi:hypothetical protein